MRPLAVRSRYRGPVDAGVALADDTLGSDDVMESPKPVRGDESATLVWMRVGRDFPPPHPLRCAYMFEDSDRCYGPRRLGETYCASHRGGQRYAPRWDPDVVREDEDRAWRTQRRRRVRLAVAAILSIVAVVVWGVVVT